MPALFAFEFCTYNDAKYAQSTIQESRGQRGGQRAKAEESQVFWRSLFYRSLNLRSCACSQEQAMVCCLCLQECRRPL